MCCYTSQDSFLKLLKDTKFYQCVEVNFKLIKLILLDLLIYYIENKMYNISGIIFNTL